ncbi:MAG: hemolysin III family protein [Spirochaetes bacterium]|nr:hemolysin III family protein [Spirochaetota bacterium]
MPVNRSELLSFYSHAVGVIIAIVGLVILIFTASTPIIQLLSVIYGISVIVLFTASTLYHGLKQHEDEDSLWRRLDHMAIFIMIAGTYTPVCYIYLEFGTAMYIIAAQWVLVVLGIIFKLYFFNAPRIVYTAIYLAMGWMAIIVIKDIINVMDAMSLWYLFLGGVAFTVGALFYIVKWPKKTNGYVGFHEIFHGFILLGAFFHYMMVYHGIQHIQTIH